MGGGASLPKAVGDKLYEVTVIEYIEGYGFTETISHTHFNPPNRPKMQCLWIPSFDVDLRVDEYRTEEAEGMLMRRDLKEIPKFMNQGIIKFAQGTNFSLTKDEYERILKLWQNPKLVQSRLELSLLEKYLYIFALSN